MNKEAYEIIEEIEQDGSHGASHLALRALDALSAVLRGSNTEDKQILSRLLDTASRKLISVRPSMAPITTLVCEASLAIHKGLSIETREEEVLSFCLYQLDMVKNRYTQARTDLLHNFLALTNNGDTYLTCSYSSTIVELCRLIFQKGLKFRVIIAESTTTGRILYGNKLAEEINVIGIPVEILRTNNLGNKIHQIFRCISGVDSILKDGTVVNGHPTLSMVRTAHENGIPYYPVGESAKVNLRSLLGKEVTVESGFEKIHPLFIKAIVTEYGIERPETVLSRINAEEYRDFISS